MRKSETFMALNGLRFFAALAVVIFHYATRVDGYARVPGFFRNLIDQGPCAVSFFFILSGFLLGYRYLYSGPRAESRVDFYWSRILRLYPAYLLAFLLFLPVAVERYVWHAAPGVAHRHLFAWSAVLSAFMLQSWTPLAQAWNGPSWSLSVEAFMYLTFPFIASQVARLTERRAAALLCASWMMPSLLAVAYVGHSIPEATWRVYVTNNPLLWLPLFVVGICASRMATRWKRVTERKAAILSTAALAVLILVCLAWPHRWSDVLVTGGIAPLQVAVIIFFTRRSGWTARIIGGRLLNQLGEASYAVYVLQAPLWHYWQPFTNYLRRVPLQTNVAELWQFVTFVPFLVISSLAVERFIEAPVRSWAQDCKKRNFGSALRRPSEAIASCCRC